MKPLDGIQKFLNGLISQSLMTNDDLEKAIHIAGNYQPSSAFKRAQEYWQINKSKLPVSALAFAKGVRWLSMLRRDQGQQAFESEIQKLKELMKNAEQSA